MADHTLTLNLGGLAELIQLTQTGAQMSALTDKIDQLIDAVKAVAERVTVIERNHADERAESARVVALAQAEATEQTTRADELQKRLDARDADDNAAVASLDSAIVTLGTVFTNPDT